MLSDDWTKSIHLQNDRSVELHTQGGFHYRTRIPRFGRALAYHFPSCDALVAGAGPDVFRLNLDQGRFLNPLCLQSGDETDVPGVNALDINPAHRRNLFHSPCHHFVRLSFGPPLADLDAGLDAIGRVLKKAKGHGSHIGHGYKKSIDGVHGIDKLV